MTGKILMTTGYNFDGYSINKYIDVFSGECALGTGFLSSLNSGISDLFGTNSESYTNKLKQAKDYALEQLQSQTIKAGGDAIIGLSINYTMFSRDIIGVVANGTAVKIDAIRSEKSNDIMIPILKYNRNTGFSPVVFSGYSHHNQYAFSIELFHHSEKEISSILVDLKFVTVFEKVYELKDVAFTDFSIKNNSHLVSDYTILSIPCENISLLKNVIIITKKYILNNELIDISDKDLEKQLDQENPYANIPPLFELDKLNTMKEIYEYLKNHMKKYDQSEPELMQWFEKSVEIERLYGNQKKEAIEYVKNYYHVDY